MLAVLVGVLGLEAVCRYTAVGVPWNVDAFGRRISAGRPLPSSAVRLVCLGDSLTFGARVREDWSYPSQLEILLATHRKQVQVVNAGICGHTSVQTLARIGRDALSFGADIVVLWVGTNDGMLKNRPDPKIGECPHDRAPMVTMSALLTTLDSFSSVLFLTSALGRPDGDLKDLSPRVDVHAFSSAYERILRRMIPETGAQVIALKIPRVPDHFMHAPKDLVETQRRIHAEYNLVITRLCKQYRVPVLSPDAFLDAGCYLNDGLHFNEEGNSRVARAVLGALFSTCSSSLWTKPEDCPTALLDKPSR